MRRALRLEVAVLAVLAAVAPGPEAEQPGGEGGAGELEATVRRITGPLEELRGLAFKSELDTRRIGKPEARAYLSRLLARDYPPRRLAAEEASYRYFGFMEGEARLEPLLLDLLESQVAGFYDPASKKLFVVPGPLSGSLALAHEMAHALVDQHFDLEALQADARHDDDRMLALAALIEGEATMVTYLWGFRSAMDPKMPALVEGDPAALMEAAASGLDAVPPFLSQSLTFPYLTGGVWASEIMKKNGGLKGLDPYFARPPDSTEQILHPERSMEPRDLPSRIAPSVLEGLLEEGEPEVKRGAMGEFGILFLLGGSGDETARESAGGWDADLFMVAGREGADHLSWISVWDSPEDAGQFLEAAGKWLASRERLSHIRRDGVVVALAEGRSPGGPAPEARVKILLERAPAGITIR